MAIPIVPGTPGQELRRPDGIWRYTNQYGWTPDRTHSQYQKWIKVVQNPELRRKEQIKSFEKQVEQRSRSISKRQIEFERQKKERARAFVRETMFPSVIYRKRIREPVIPLPSERHLPPSIERALAIKEPRIVPATFEKEEVLRQRALEREPEGYRRFLEAEEAEMGRYQALIRRPVAAGLAALERADIEMRKKFKPKLITIGLPTPKPPPKQVTTVPAIREILRIGEETALGLQAAKRAGVWFAYHPAQTVPLATSLALSFGKYFKKPGLIAKETREVFEDIAESAKEDPSRFAIQTAALASPIGKFKLLSDIPAISEYAIREKKVAGVAVLFGTAPLLRGIRAQTLKIGKTKIAPGEVIPPEVLEGKAAFPRARGAVQIREQFFKKEFIPSSVGKMFKDRPIGIHATPARVTKLLKPSEIVVKDGALRATDVPGMYFSGKGLSEFFLRLKEGKGEPALFPTLGRPKAFIGIGKDISIIPGKGLTSARAFLRTKAEKGKFFITYAAEKGKPESEAVFAPGTILKKAKEIKPFYLKRKGKIVTVDIFEAIGKKGKPVKEKIKIIEKRIDPEEFYRAIQRERISYRKVVSSAFRPRTYAPLSKVSPEARPSKPKPKPSRIITITVPPERISIIPPKPERISIRPSRIRLSKRPIKPTPPPPETRYYPSITREPLPKRFEPRPRGRLIAKKKKKKKFIALVQPTKYTPSIGGQFIGKYIRKPPKRVTGLQIRGMLRRR